MTDYVDRVISELIELRDRKINECRIEHERRDKYMVENLTALKSLSTEIKSLLDKNPETLHGALKQFKGTTGFIKTLTNGIIFPDQNKVDITMKLPKYDLIRKIITQ